MDSLHSSDYFYGFIAIVIALVFILRYLLRQYYPLVKVETAARILRSNKVQVINEQGYLRCSRHRLSIIRARNIKHHYRKKTYRWIIKEQGNERPEKALVLDKKRQIYLVLENIYNEDYYGNFPNFRR